MSTFSIHTHMVMIILYTCIMHRARTYANRASFASYSNLKGHRFDGRFWVECEWILYYFVTHDRNVRLTWFSLVVCIAYLSYVTECSVPGRASGVGRERVKNSKKLRFVCSKRQMFDCSSVGTNRTNYLQKQSWIQWNLFLCSTSQIFNSQFHRVTEKSKKKKK